mgnify:CR=1 FL=1
MKVLLSFWIISLNNVLCDILKGLMNFVYYIFLENIFVHDGLMTIDDIFLMVWKSFDKLWWHDADFKIIQANMDFKWLLPYCNLGIVTIKVWSVFDFANNLFRNLYYDWISLLLIIWAFIEVEDLNMNSIIQNLDLIILSVMEVNRLGILQLTETIVLNV